MNNYCMFLNFILKVRKKMLMRFDEFILFLEWENCQVKFWF